MDGPESHCNCVRVCESFEGFSQWGPVILRLYNNEISNYTIDWDSCIALRDLRYEIYEIYIVDFEFVIS